MGNKRFQRQFLDHRGLPKKTKLVSLDDNENNIRLVEASF